MAKNATPPGGKARRVKGESTAAFNERANKVYKEDAVELKKEEGRWLPKEEYERLTGKRGRKD